VAPCRVRAAVFEVDVLDAVGAVGVDVDRWTDRTVVGDGSRTAGGRRSQQRGRVDVVRVAATRGAGSGRW
jgi:hypothetical protein